MPIINRVLKLLTPNERSGIYRLVFFDALVSMLDIAFLVLLLWLINFYTGGTPATTGYKLSFSILINPVLCIGLFLTLFAIKNWMAYRVSLFEHHFFYNVASRLSKKNLLYYLRNNYLQFINVDSSVRIRQISHKPVEFSHYILTNLQQIATQSLLILFTACAIIFYHPSLFFLLLLFLLPPVIVLGVVIRKRSRKIRAQTQLASQKAIQHLQESLSGYVESNIYDKSDFFTGRYHQYQQQVNNNLATQQTLMALPARLIELFAILGVFILAAVNQYRTGAAITDLFTIGVFMAAAYKIIPGMVKILNSAGQIKTYEPILADLLSFEDSIYPAKPTADAINSISFENVSFKYKQEPVLKDICFNLTKGDIAGLWGRSGSGKSTLIHLLTGFLSPQSGAVIINNDKMPQDYRSRVSYVKQQPYFIHDTLLKNITLEDGDHDAKKLADIITFCGLNALLQTYPERLNTLITENGKNISGGQRQRVMLARALYHDFDVLVLDEPFSEMDEVAEIYILKQLQQLAAQGKIIILVTHDKGSLDYCNKVINLDE